MSTEGYVAFAGKCRAMSEAAVAADPTLRLVRGWYHCPLWGKRGHWWAVRPDGAIVDPTVTQFPTAGAGAEYEEHLGLVDCDECGKQGVPEAEAITMSNYAFCSSRCAGRFVGVC